MLRVTTSQLHNNHNLGQRTSGNLDVAAVCQSQLTNNGDGVSHGGHEVSLFQHEISLYGILEGKSACTIIH